MMRKWHHSLPSHQRRSKKIAATMIASHLLLLLLLVSSTRTAIAKTINVTYLDCGMRALAMRYADRLTKDTEVLQDIYDALRVRDLCGVKLPTTTSSKNSVTSIRRRVETLCPTATTLCVYVDPNPPSLSATPPTGTLERPFSSLHDALKYARQSKDTAIITKLVLRQGIHSLSEPLALTEHDSNFVLTGFPGEQAWISGGIAVENVEFEPWSANSNILVADLTTLLANKDLPKIMSLFTSERRYIRARFPNADPERDQWGYASYHRLNYSLDPTLVEEWHKPKKGPLPEFTFVDMTTNPPAGVPVKNNSDMYNWYASGHGGVCSDVWGPDAHSYWCSNASQGGWAEVDQECATTGQMQIPVGMTYNLSTDVGQRLANSTCSLVGGMVHVWHSQSWAMHMFEIDAALPLGQLQFAKGGGRQGGRNWCRCDQCTYAGGWCGQHQTPPIEDTRLISGTWMIENVLSELDRPGEYYFDRRTKNLYVWPNSTLDVIDFRISMLERLVDISNATNITIENLGFRDMAATYMSDWSAPSGGDWSLHRGGAVFLENVEQVTIQNCLFSRLDGNGIFLSRKTRNVTIQDNRFEWLGESAIATWGDTEDYDATAGNFPMYTLIQQNIMRELGIYQKQSSAVGQCKAALTTVRNNIMFNTPRAAINLNDMMGGGDVIEGNLIFNTCRESGDHGPINTWDRQPFLTTLKDGSRSFDPIPRIITNNFIFANYGASQGVDNDDGSSWYQISNNIFYSAEGFKMDYGGHDSIFEGNLVMSYPYDGQQCFTLGGFLEGHGDKFQNNICIIGLGNKMDSGCGDPSCASPIPDDKASLEVVGRLWGGCQDSPVVLAQNQYYTPDGKAMIYCGDDELSLDQIQEQFRLELGSSVAEIPSEETILEWARSKVSHMVSPSQEVVVE